MKILMTTDTLGGVWTYCMELCAALKPHGVDIILATMGRKLSPIQHRQLQRLANVQLRESEFRLCWMEDPWDDIEEAGEWLLALEREVEPDLVHLNDLGHGNLPWQSPVLLVGHSCVFSWWDAVKGETAPLEHWHRYQNLIRASVLNADLIVAPSEAMLTALLQYYGPVRASHVIANGRSFPALTPVADLARKREPFILSAGRVWDDAKNIEALTAIASEIPWPVYIAGEQQDPHGGVKAVGGAKMLGFLDEQELAHWLQSAAIYVAPAFYEPFGLSILEAARAGCALVLGNIASLREIWGDAAVYVDPHQPEQLRQRLMTLIEDGDQRRTLAAHAQRRSQRYTSTSMAAQYLHVYQELCSKGAPPLHSIPLLPVATGRQIPL